jgi:hypothetical protein
MLVIWLNELLLLGAYRTVVVDLGAQLIAQEHQSFEIVWSYCAACRVTFLCREYVQCLLIKKL